MNNWKEYNMHQLVNKPKSDIVDGPFGSNLKASEYTISGIPIIRLQNIDRNKFIFKNIKYISSPKAKQLERHNFKRGDIVITKLGDPLGKACEVPKSLDNGIIVADIVRVRSLRENLINKKFLLYQINSSHVSDQLKKLTKGTTRPRVNLSHVRNTIVKVPPLTEQQKIVEIIEELFSELDKGLERLKKAQQQLKTYRQAVLKAAFEGKLNNSKNDLIEHDSGIIYPSNWDLLNIGSISDSMKNGIYKPKSFYNNDGIACLRMYNIQNGKIEWYNIKRMILSNSEISEYLLQSGDILVNRVNSRELVGKSAIITDKLEKSVYESKNIRLKLKRNVNPSFVNYWLLKYANTYFNRNAQQTVGMASINQSQLSKMPIPIPTQDIQDEIVNEIESRYSICDHLEKTIEENLQKAESLRQSILKQAFEGKLTGKWREENKELIKSEIKI